jgi:hypothetical protein
MFPMPGEDLMPFKLISSNLLVFHCWDLPILAHQPAGQYSSQHSNVRVPAVLRLKQDALFVFLLMVVAVMAAPALFSQTFPAALSFAGTQTTVTNGLNGPNGLAVDGAGDVFIVDSGFTWIVEVPANGGAQITVASGLYGASGVVRTRGWAPSLPFRIVESPVCCNLIWPKRYREVGKVSPINCRIHLAGNRPFGSGRGRAVAP